MHGDPGSGHHPRTGDYPDILSTTSHKIQFALRHKMQFLLRIARSTPLPLLTEGYTGFTE